MKLFWKPNLKQINRPNFLKLITCFLQYISTEVSCVGPLKTFLLDTAMFTLNTRDQEGRGISLKWSEILFTSVLQISHRVLGPKSPYVHLLHFCRYLPVSTNQFSNTKLKLACTWTSEQSHHTWTDSEKTPNWNRKAPVKRTEWHIWKCPSEQFLP